MAKSIELSVHGCLATHNNLIRALPKRQIFVHYLKQVILLNAFEAFLHSSIFDKIIFCLGEKQGMLVNNEYSPWYNK